ncbi:MAG: lipopolysaccharide biosynthesis protein [Bacilli bacterium]|jgi:O-antigen/teichoic acid export membrane protein
MRTKYTTLNFVTSFFPWLIIAVIGFVKIKLFIQYFGPEMNGLIQLSGQLYAYLSLMELGFGSAIIYSLYKPFVDNDQEKISQLFVGAKSIFKKIGFLIFLGGFLLSIIVPFIITNLQIPRLYVFAVFFLYAWDYLSMYFLLLPYKVLLQADQKKYKLNIITNTRHLIFRLIELLLIINKVNLLLIIIGSITANLISNLFVIKTVKKEYPWLNKKDKADTSPMGMTKDVFFHKINRLVFNHTDNIILSIAQGLTTVSIYGAYNYIISYLNQILNYIFKAPQASMGNLHADEKVGISKKEAIFNEYLSLSFYFALLVVPLFIVSVSSFISVWINKTFVLSSLAIILFGFILWYEFILVPLVTTLEAKGEYKNIKKADFYSAITNLVLSFILVFKYGIVGVLIGTVVSYALVSHILYVRYVYQSFIEKPVLIYYKKYIVFLISLIIVIFSQNILIKGLNLYNNDNIFQWFLETSFIGSISLIVITFLFYFFYSSFQNFINRVLLKRVK